MSVTTRDPIAVVQAAVDLAQAARQADALITEINEGDRALGDRRLRLGRLLRDVRRQIPTSGPRARAWGEFCEARGISRDTALRHIALADYSDAHADDQRSPSEIYAGIVAKDSPHGAANPYPALTAPGPQLFAAQQALAPAEKAPPKAQPQSLPAANLPKPVDLNTCNRTDLWQRFVKGELTSPEALERRKTWSPEQLEADEVIRLEYKAAVKAARVAGRTDPPMPPMPIGWLTAGATPPSKPAADPAAAARKALEAAEALGKEGLTRKSLMIGEVVSKLRQAGHLIPSGQDSTVYRAYTESRQSAVAAKLRGEAPAPAAPAAPAVDPRQAALPLAEPPRPAPYKPLFDELREAVDEVEDELAHAKQDIEALRADLVQARRELDEARELAERLRETGRQRFAEVDQARELAARERDEARAEVAALRAKLEAAETRLTERGQQLHQQRQDGAELLRRAQRAEAELCALREGGEPEEEARPVWEVLPAVTETSWEDLGYKWASVAWRPEGCTPEQREDPDWLCEVQLEKHDRQLDDLRTVEREVLIRGARTRIQEQAPSKPAAWQPASIGGAQAVHALALGAVAEGDHAHPAALCKQRPNYKSKAGWMPRPGTPLTCKGCIAATNEETK